MKNKRSLVSIVVLILVVVFGVNEELLISINDWIDPPAAGHARVEEVVDGDTIIVRFGGSKERIRFIGVDTPETNHPDKAVQCYGKEATNYLKSLIENSDVRLEMDPTNTNRDRYDRLLRYVYDEEGNLVNLRIVEDGYGFAYTSFPFQKMDEFVEAETRARQRESGLWSACEIEESNGYINTAPA